MKRAFLILLTTTLFLGSTGCVSSKKTSKSELEGLWELNYISGKRIAFEGLYPDKKPHIIFDLNSNKISGNSSCNGFGSTYTISKNTISIGSPLGTMMACEGSGEKDFYQMLQKINRYSVDNLTLTFLIDDIALMRFQNLKPSIK